jgi:DNA-binding NarL/FixJ family response regulator
MAQNTLQHTFSSSHQQARPNESLESLAAAIQAELVVPTEAADLWPEAAARPSAPVEPLTPRELEVLRLLAAGRGNDEIARELVVAAGTVKAHTSSIYRKLDVDNRTRAVIRARELGLID